MVVLNIENNNGYRLGAIRLTENNEDGEIEIKEIEDNIQLENITFDYIFDTNEQEVTVSIKNTRTFGSHNHDNVGAIPEECKQLVKEYNSYKVLLDYYNNYEYYDCYIIIANYMGHINYGTEFGYFKTHEDICKILFESLLSSLDPRHNKDRFVDFIERMMRKIVWNLEHKHNYDIKTNSYMER